ncbi:2Fe-2S iron-sulfur cluster-binding protein [Roseovarius arcticus]|uniref:2Fe-2S iron-sulfur cluster-binding protein n=1 Tax=Roseovarius arcticus TaxID=2547404 RepID=UPI0011101613
MSKTIEIFVNEASVSCAPGIPLSQVLSQHFTAWRHSPRLGQPRGMYCGMGICFECTVQVDGIPRRSCLVDTAEGMTVTTEGGAHAC